MSSVLSRDVVDVFCSEGDVEQKQKQEVQAVGERERPKFNLRIPVQQMRLH